MGDVYLAEDTSLRRKVALKKLSRALIDAEAHRQLLHEARAAGRLNHPNIAAIHDVVEGEDGSCIVMEYVPGRTLSARIREGPVPFDEAVDIALQLTDALTAAHSEGVIHRDLKPANIHLTPEGRVKVLDFGLARTGHRSEIGSEDSTSSGGSLGEGMVVGTLPYMPPESLRGETADERGDLYSLGVTLFELLTGRLPFEAANRAAFIAAVMSSEAPEVSSINREIPEALSGVIARAMARNPDNRYRTAGDMKRDLRLLRAGGRNLRRLIGVAAIAAMLAAVIVLAGRATNGMKSGGTAGRAVAVLPFLSLSPDSTTGYVAAGITDIIGTNLAGLPLSVIPAGETRPYRSEDRDLAELSAELGASLVIDGSVQKYGDRLRVTVKMLREGSKKLDWSQSYDGEMGSILGLQERILNGLADGLVSTGTLDASVDGGERDRFLGPPTRNEEAYADYIQGRAFLERGDRPENIRRAITLFESAFRKDADFAQALGGLSEAHWALYRSTRDRQSAETAMETAQEAVALDSTDSAVRLSLATLLLGTGRYVDAERELARVIEARPDDAEPHSILGDVHERQGRKARAIEEYRKAIMLRPAYWKHHWRLANLHYQNGDLDRSITEARRVIELQPDNHWGYQMLGTAYQARGNIQEARIEYEKSLELAPTAAAYSNIGGKFFDEGEYAIAVSYYEKACAMDPGNPILFRNLGDGLLELGKQAEAINAYTRAVDLADSVLAVNPNEPNTIALQALCLAKTHRGAESLGRIQRAMELNPTSPNILYKRTAILALLDQRSEALQALKVALDAGLPAAFAAADPDLRSLTGDAEFQRLISR